eukprot:CAMPEP_0114994982 /NCGR_PEP_ID=MMETSP0216-20121206/13457_1 /TAXON_ID=223996 /ORGANISM="Protocruzia adherens, Strain Boccale" /LENGTH=99 /DNA_ID=CAMNT_0002358935 /DNA_START=109 /DNA_END=404 /DNA_ORIENTATION=+
MSKIPNLPKLLNISHDETSLREAIMASCPNSKVPSEGLKVYKLLRYILATNRLTLKRLMDVDLIPGINSSITQFIVSNNAPDRETIFANRKKKHGSVFA